MAGCFGGSQIDRWMESNLDRYLDEGFGEIKVTFNLFKGKKLVET